MGLLAAGQVALTSFPFSDLSRSKLRPAIIIAAAGRNDWIVCQITSNPFGDSRSFSLTPSDFSAGGLQHISYVRPGKIFTAHEALIGIVVGTLTAEALTTVRDAVVAVIQRP
jgi:mRNA interferase MazF